MKKIIISATGVGLSAPQIGINKRFFIIDLGYCETLKTSRLEEFINPIILSTSDDEVDSREGCLSLPGVWATIKRYREIVLEWVDDENQTRIKTFDGLASKVIQHEIDHLDGIYFTDRLEESEKKKIKHQLKRIKRGLITPEYEHLKYMQ